MELFKESELHFSVTSYAPAYSKCLAWSRISPYTIYHDLMLANFWQPQPQFPFVCALAVTT